jgi:vancomycin resistance protein YoaR
MIAGAIAVALLLGVVTAVFAFTGDVPRGTTVLGIDLGGQSRSAAARTLRAGLGGRLDAPVAVRVGDQNGSVRPADAGLAVDIDATISRAAAGSPRLVGSRVVAPVITVDGDRLAEALREPAAKVATAITPPAVRFEGLSPKPVYPRPGKGIDKQTSVKAFVDGWLRSDVITVPVVDLVALVTASDVDSLIATLARPAVAAPVTVRLTDGRSFTIPPEAVAKSLVLAGDVAVAITPRVDEGALRSSLRTQLAAVETQPKLAEGTGNVFASTGGQLVDTAALARDLLTVLPLAPPRTVPAVLRTVPPKTASEDLTRLGVREQVSTFTTYFTGGLSAPRSRNIVTIATKVDGAIVQPGQTFSLNGFTGPRDYAQGYLDAPVLLDGRLVPGVGGGVSQFTTTLFNAVYYAGLEDVFHKPHGFYFSRYPPVIESTIFYPTLDFKFRNDSPYGVLIDTSYKDNSITVSIWSTKRYDISTKWGPKRDVVEPRNESLPAGPSCIATEGSRGFTQDAWRIFRQGGKEIRREKFTWRYDAEPHLTCR